MFINTVFLLDLLSGYVLKEVFIERTAHTNSYIGSHAYANFSQTSETTHVECTCMVHQNDFKREINIVLATKRIKKNSKV